MMKKRIWMRVMFLAVSACLMAAPVEVGETSQCWSFDQAPIGGSFAFADPGTLDNEFGVPTAIISDMTGPQGDLIWNDSGYLMGSEFKIVLDIPNQPIENPYKILNIDMVFQGDIDFLWVADAVSGEHFTPTGPADIEDVIGTPWKTFSQEFRFEPNPREELVVIGFKGTQEVSGQPIPAALDQICIDTICIPEPVTLALLAVGGVVCVVRRKRA